MDWTSIIQWFDLQKILGFSLVLFRVAGIFLVSPVFGNRAIPAHVKLALAVLMTLVLMPVAPFHDKMAEASDLYLIRLVIQEITVGVAIGLVAAILFAAFQAAGELVGMNLGFSIAQIVDPSNQGASGIFATFYVIFGAVIFLYLNGHHLILMALSQSFKLIPVGQGMDLLAGKNIASLITEMIGIGIKIAAPVIIVLTLINLIFGFLTKLSPQMNIYFNVGFIISPVVGIAVVILTLPLFRVVISDWSGNFGPELMQFVRELKGS